MANDKGIEEILEAIGLGKRHAHPQSSDPTTYPRSAKIIDPVALGYIEKIESSIGSLEELRHKIEAITEEVEALFASNKVTKRRLFELLRLRHPDVDNGRSGYRRFDGQLYFVGWDGDEPTPKQNGETIH